MSTLSRDDTPSRRPRRRPSTAWSGGGGWRPSEPGAARAARGRRGGGAGLDHRAPAAPGPRRDQPLRLHPADRRDALDPVVSRRAAGEPGPLDLHRDERRGHLRRDPTPSRAIPSRDRRAPTCRSSSGGARRRAPTAPTAPTAASRRRWATRRSTTSTRRCPTSRPTRSTSSIASSRCAWPTSRSCWRSSPSRGRSPGCCCRDRSLQTLATAAVALNPQLTHLAAVVNPDLFLAAVWTAFFYLSILVITRGPTRGRVAGIARLSRRLVPDARPRHRDPRPRGPRPRPRVVAMATAEQTRRGGVLDRRGGLVGAGGCVPRAALRDAGPADRRVARASSCPTCGSSTCPSSRS